MLDKAWMMENLRRKHVSGFKTYTVKKFFGLIPLALDSLYPKKSCFPLLMSELVRTDRDRCLCVWSLENAGACSPHLYAYFSAQAWCEVQFTCVEGAASQNIVTVMAIWNIWHSVMWPKGAAVRSWLAVLGFQFGLKLLSHMTLRSHSNVAQRYNIGTSHFQDHISLAVMTTGLRCAGNNSNNNACQT